MEKFTFNPSPSVVFKGQETISWPFLFCPMGPLPGRLSAYEALVFI